MTLDDSKRPGPSGKDIAATVDESAQAAAVGGTDKKKPGSEPLSDQESRLGEDEIDAVLSALDAPSERPSTSVPARAESVAEPEEVTHYFDRASLGLTVSAVEKSRLAASTPGGRSDAPAGPSVVPTKDGAQDSGPKGRAKLSSASDESHDEAATQYYDRSSLLGAAAAGSDESNDGEDEATSFLDRVSHGPEPVAQAPAAGVTAAPNTDLPKPAKEAGSSAAVTAAPKTDLPKPAPAAFQRPAAGGSVVAKASVPRPAATTAASGSLLSNRSTGLARPVSTRAPAGSPLTQDVLASQPATDNSSALVSASIGLGQVSPSDASAVAASNVGAALGDEGVLPVGAAARASEAVADAEPANIDLSSAAVPPAAGVATPMSEVSNDLPMPEAEAAVPALTSVTAFSMVPRPGTPGFEEEAWLDPFSVRIRRRLIRSVAPTLR